MDPSGSRRFGANQDRSTRAPGTAMKSARKTELRSEGSQPERPPPVPRHSAPAPGRETGGSQSLQTAAGLRAGERLPGPNPRPLAEARVIRSTKQTGGPVRPPGQQPPGGVRRDAGRDDVQRKVARKMPSAMPLSQKRPQSSFNYIAPLLRGPPAISKSAPRKPAYLAIQSQEPVRTPRKNVEDDALGNRSAQRISIGAMSIQRRAALSPRKAVVPPRPRTHREFPIARGRGVVQSVSPVSDSSDSVDYGDDIPPRVRLPRAARKTVSESHRKGVKAARKQPVEADSAIRSLGKAARKLNIKSDVEEEDIIELSSDEEEDIEELLDALDALTLGPLQLRRQRRLPFLLRNLRLGFEDRSSRAGIPTSPEEKPGAPVKVVYRYYPGGFTEGDEDDLSDEEDCQEWIGNMSDWSCPLCQLHSPFRTRAMLVYHLNRDHGEVKVSWAEINIRSTRRWRLMFVLPDHEGLTEPIPDEDEDEDDVGRGNEMYMKEEVTSEEAEESHLGSSLRSSSASPIAPHFREPLFLPGSDDEESPAPVTPPQFPEVVEEFKPKLDRVSATPEDRKSLLSASVPPTQQSRATTFSATRFSYRGSLPARYPSPPPPDDRLGPAAQYPYLPETNDDQPIYSCRIGGPRIYDLLNELPLDEFGVMSWAVVDREEELFEMEDVRDEDKVMLALWNRWIMLNKSSFIFNDYDKGVQKFLDCYWQMIHRAAGWRALRAFLMMLQVNKYLTLTKVIAALKYYEEKIGMELWYKDAQEETA